MPEDLHAKFSEEKKMNATFGDVTVVHTDDYEKIINHPFINGFEVIGHKTGDDYGLQNKVDFATKHDIDKIIYGIGGE